MSIQKYALAGETPPRLELHMEGMQMKVMLDGVHVGSMEGWDGLTRGWSTQLEDGSVLEVRMIRRMLFPELSILRNGMHVPSSPSHPEKVLRSSSTALLLLSAFLIATGTLGAWGRTRFEAAFGVCYLFAGLLLRSGRRLGAAVAAIPLVISLDLILLAALSGQLYEGWMWDVFLDLVFFIFVVRCYQAANEKRRYAPRAG